MAYGCEILPATAEGRGLVHWVRVDLNAPGIGLYVTALDRTAVSKGWQYRLSVIGQVVTTEGLAVAINGTLFTSSPDWRPRLPGDFANSVDMTVANHVVNHFWKHTYLLWFDQSLTPHLSSKPATPGELARAKWGIGGQAAWLRDGVVSPGSELRPDVRTAIAINEHRKLLFLAVAEWISPHLLLQTLADLGAREGMLLDGGGSSAMAIGQGAQGVPAGPIYGGLRPAATFFGVRARSLRSSK